MLSAIYIVQVFFTISRLCIINNNNIIVYGVQAVYELL